MEIDSLLENFNDDESNTAIDSLLQKQAIQKLDDWFNKKTQENNLKITKYQTQIAKERVEVNEKFQVYQLKFNDWLNQKKIQEETWYKNKVQKLETVYHTKLNQEKLSYKKTIINNNYLFKKNNFLQEHKTKQEQLTNKYQVKIKALEKWYQEKNDDFDWNLNNFSETLVKGLEHIKGTKIAKINHQFDKQRYQTTYQTLATTLKVQIAQTTDNLLKKELTYQYRNLPLQIWSEQNLTYQPWKVWFNNKLAEQKLKFKLKINDIKSSFHNLKYLSAKEIISSIIQFRVFSIPLYLYTIIIAVTALAIYSNTLPKGTMGSMAVLFVVAIIGGEIFNRLPIWKTYIGGGTMGVFFVGALLGTFNVFPAAVVAEIYSWFSDGGFLNLYINILIVGSILTISRNLIVRSFSGFMFLLIVGTGIAVLFAWGFGNLVGIPIDKNVLQIMLPLLSAGNGGGVQPLSVMSASYGYMPHDQYVSFALAVSSLSNIFVIVIAALLVAALGKSGSMSGNGKLVKKEIRLPKETINPSHRNICAGLIFAIVIYIFSSFIETEIKRNTGIVINAFVWVVLIALLINLLNILPKDLKDGTNILNKFFTKQFTLFIMAGVGLCMTDLNTFISLFANWKYVADILIMDFGLLLGPLLFAKLIKFYTLESMIAAGCCMGAQGGAGSLAVLGAGKRMDLVPYSQITARIGGGMILIVAAPLFSYFVGAGFGQ